MKTTALLGNKAMSRAAQSFLVGNPDIAQEITEQNSRGDFDAEYTPSTVEVKYEGLTYIRLENGEVTATRECSEGYTPPFWEVWFDEEEIALFVFGKGEVLLDRTSRIAEMDSLLEQCKFVDKSGS